VLHQKEHVKSMCFMEITHLQFYVAHRLNKILHLHMRKSEARQLEKKCEALGLSRYYVAGDRGLQCGCVTVCNTATPRGEVLGGIWGGEVRSGRGLKFHAGGGRAEERKQRG